MRILFLILCLSIFSIQAQADVFIWKDSDTGVKASFPDTWKIIHNQQPDTILTVIAPDSDAMPICRLRYREDKRFQMYPVQFESDIQKVAYSRNFWADYLNGQYRDLNMTHEMDQSGLGKSFASHTFFNYMGDPEETDAFRQGIGFASHYFDFGLIAECTANQTGYPDWVQQFTTFFGSIDYPTIYGTHVNGKYRDFIHKDARQE